MEKKTQINLIKQNDLEQEQEQLFKWLKERKAIKISVIESASKVPKDTLRHFIKKKRRIPLNHFNNALNELKRYGYEKCNDK